jgi:hypothetical protein
VPNQPIIKIGEVEIAEMSKRARTAVVGKVHDDLPPEVG